MTEPFLSHTGRVAVLPQANVDTDQIIPKQFLKRVDRTGFGPHLFHDWRYRADGTPDPDFPLNRPEAVGASILVAGANFGCGSSREHAVWALRDYGFRAVIAPSFADIFLANCCQNRVVTARLPAEAVAELMARGNAAPQAWRVTVDLEAQRVMDGEGFSARFEVDPYHRDMLMQGLDQIGATLQHDALIAAFERHQAKEWMG